MRSSGALRHCGALRYCAGLRQYGPPVISSLAVTALLAGCGVTHRANQSPPNTTAESATTTSRTSAPAAAPAAWTSRSLPVGIGVLNDVTCPSATQCYAVGGMEYGSSSGWIVASDDGGDTWQVENSASQSWFSAIACPTATRCVAIGGTSTGQDDSPLVVVTTDGHLWSPVTLPSGVDALSDVACASTTSCVAVGSSNGYLRTTDGGSSWTVESSAAGLATTDSVRCPTPSFCLVGGAGPGPGASSLSMSALSHDGGLSWSAAVVAGGPSGLGQIACSTPLSCVGLIGSDATNTYGTGAPIVTSDGGHTWTKGSTGVGGAVSCARDVCVSVGAMFQSTTNTYPGDAFLSIDGGRDWSSMTVPTAQSLTAVACRSATNCVAVGGDSFDGTGGVILTYRT
jgi:hypothetical protein